MMMFKPVVVACLAALLSAGAAAQAPSRLTSTPATTFPGASAARMAPRPPPAPMAAKVNLNTGTAAQLDNLPHVGKARTKAIMDERAKGNFRDWADFDKRMQGTSVNNGVKNRIRDLVVF